MNNKIIYDNYRKQLINLHGLTITIVTIAEIAAYLLQVYQGTLNLSLTSPYLWIKVVLPISLNYIGFICDIFINNHSKFKDETKNSLLINISLLTAISISVFHREFITSFSAFIFPIFLSGMFNDKKHLNRSFCVSIFFLILYILRSTAETYTTIESIINYISFFGIIVIAYLFGLISINFFDFNFYIIENQSITNDRLRKKIKTDALTGLYNRDTMHIETGRSIEIYKEVGIPFCLAIIDIDNFKMINDTYGHNNGDIVLKKISNVLKHTCNENDCVCRFGGDEFAIIFNNKSAEDVKAVTYSIMTDISNLAYSFTNIKITCSCGIAEYNGNMSSSELFNIADRNMYQAKNNGKNQIYC